MLLSALLSAKAAAAVGTAVVALTAGTTAAAYAGVLPASLQEVASTVVGAPSPADSTESPVPSVSDSESPEATESETPDADESESPEAKASPSADAQDPASHGLCNAREHGGLPEHSQGYAKLVGIAGTATVADYCFTVLHPGETPSPAASPSESETAAAATTAPKAHGKSAQHKKDKPAKTHGRSAAARS